MVQLIFATFVLILIRRKHPDRQRIKIYLSQDKIKYLNDLSPLTMILRKNGIFFSFPIYLNFSNA